MPPATPTFTLTPDATNRLMSIVVNNGGSTVSYNRVWRATPTEYNGAFICITQLLAQDGTFFDLNIASGLTYSYYVTAVDGSGATATSITKSDSLTLTDSVLHSVPPKNSATANGSNDAYYLEIGETRQYGRASQLSQVINSIVPVTSSSDIQDDQIALTIRVPSAADSKRETLRNAYISRLYLCLRNVVGSKWFGVLLNYGESYDYGFVDLNLTFGISDYNESVI